MAPPEPSTPSSSIDPALVGASAAFPPTPQRRQRAVKAVQDIDGSLPVRTKAAMVDLFTNSTIGTADTYYTLTQGDDETRRAWLQGVLETHTGQTSHTLFPPRLPQSPPFE